MSLNKDAYIRFSILESGPAPGLPPGIQANMFPQAGMPGHLTEKMHYLAGGKGLSDMEAVAEIRLPKEMKKLMLGRNLVPYEYDLRSFKESPDPGVMFFCMAAIRK